MPTLTGARTLFDAGARPLRVWFLLVLTGALAAWGVGYGVVLLNTFGLRPADGGVLAPLWQRVAWLVVLWALGLSGFVGMLVYARCYVARLAYDDAAGALHVRTVLPPARVVPVGEVLGGRHYRGHVDGLTTGVDAPWQTLNVRGRRLPYVIDVQGDVRDPAALGRLLRGRPPA